MTEVKIQGYGGQGAVTLATLLAAAATASGYHAQSLPFFGVERRGAPVRAVVRISDDVIRVHSQACMADVAVVLSENLLDTVLSGEIKPGAALVINAKDQIAVPEHPVTALDAAGIAVQAGLGTGSAAVNVPMYAAACRVLGFSKETTISVLRAKWGGSIGEKNVAAAEAAYTTAGGK